jgi:hypothetical protein
MSPCLGGIFQISKEVVFLRILSFFTAQLNAFYEGEIPSVYLHTPYLCHCAPAFIQHDSIRNF